MHYWKNITWATDLFNTFCWGYMNAEHGIFCIDPTTWGSPSLEKRNTLLLSLWCFIHSSYSQHNPQHVDNWLGSKGYKNAFFKLFFLFFFFLLRLRSALAMSSAMIIPKDRYKWTSAPGYEIILTAIMLPAPRKRFALESLQHAIPEAAIRSSIFCIHPVLNRLHTPSCLWGTYQPYSGTFQPK